jgi:hypothetical protein
MDQKMVNIEWESAYNGDEVILIGESGDQAVTCDYLAEQAGTIPYEILTNINTRVPRVYAGNGRVEEPFVTELPAIPYSQMTSGRSHD